MPQVKRLAAEFDKQPVTIFGMNTDKDVANAQFVAKMFDSVSETVLLWDGSCKRCFMIFPSNQPQQCIPEASQGGACGSACFCIDTSKGLAYYVGTSGPGTLTMDGSDGLTTITLSYAALTSA